MDCSIDVPSDTLICIEHGRENGSTVLFVLIHTLNYSIRLHRFYNIILLPRIRDDIDEYKKLNFHLYMVRAIPDADFNDA